MPLATRAIAPIELHDDTSKIAIDIAVAMHGLAADDSETPIKKDETYRKGHVSVDDVSGDAIKATWHIPDKEGNPRKLGTMDFIVARVGPHIVIRTSMTLPDGHVCTAQSSRYRDPHRALLEVWSTLFSDPWRTATSHLETKTDPLKDSTAFRWVRRATLWAANLWVLYYTYTILMRFGRDVPAELKTFYWTDAVSLVVPGILAIVVSTWARRVFYLDRMHRVTKAALLRLTGR